jgi:outer membrane protein
MRKSILAAVAATVLIPGAALAAPAVLIVDLDRVLTDCTACRAASAVIQQQVQQGQARAQALEAQLKPQAQSLDTAVKALGNKEPDAALQARIRAFQTSQQAAQTELANKQRQIESIQANVQQQLGNKVVAISEQIRARRGADIIIGKNATLAANSAADVTGEVLAALNQQMPSVSATPLPQQSRPTGR